MKYKNIGIGLLLIFAVSFTTSLFAADKNGEIWYQRIGGSLIKINDGEVHTYDNQIVKRTGDNLVMTCNEDCDNNVMTEFVGLVTVIADCNEKANGETITIKLKLNGVSGGAKITCQENPTYDGVGDGAMKCRSKGHLYTGKEPHNDSNFPDGWTNENVDCRYKITDPDKLESWSSSITRLNVASNFDTFSPVSESGKSVSPVEEQFIHRKNQNQLYKITGRSKDTLGNESIMNFPNYKIKIDKRGLEGTNIKMKSLRPGNGDRFRTISSNAGSPTRFEAHEKFAVDLGIVPPTINESPIDWDNSWISIIHTPVGTATPLPQRIQRPLSDTSFGMSFDRGAQLLYFTDASDIFEKAGKYQLRFHIVDEAGNEQSPAVTERYVEIVASEIAGTSFGSGLRDKYPSQKTYANNADTRTLELTLRDRFRNVISNRNVKVTIPGQDLSKASYDLTKSGGVGSLEEGLSFVGTGSPTQLRYRPTSTGKKDFRLKSYLPSLEVVFSADGKGAIMMEKKDRLGNLIGQDASFEVVGPVIKPNGYPSNVNQPPAIFETPVLFRPIVYGYLVNRLSGDGTTIPYSVVRSRMSGQHIELALGQEFPFFAYTNTGGRYRSMRPLPRNYEVEVQAHATQGLGFSNEDYLNGSVGDRSIDFCPTNNCTGVDKSEVTQTYPGRAGGVITSPRFAFSSKVNVFLGGKMVTYPGGNLGNDIGNGQKLFNTSILCPDGTDASCPDWFNHTDLEVIAIEADIEGSILGDQYSFTQDASVRGGDSKILTMGGVSAQDIREEITRKAYELIRGVKATTNTDRHTGINFNNGHNIIYVDGGTVTLGGTISGVGTIVLKDANLIIENDMHYGSSSDSLGVILINSTTNRANAADGPATGNIYVRPNVQNIVGTYFADGSIMSVGNIGTNTNLSTSTRSTQLIRQLLIQGTIFTKNTLGGVIGQVVGSDNNRTPWKELGRTQQDIETAMKYDLHWLRRYRPNAGLPYKNPLTGSNEHATVIRPDGKVRNITPPGFEIGTLIRR